MIALFSINCFTIVDTLFFKSFATVNLRHENNELLRIYMLKTGVIHLVRTQHFPKNYYFLPSDTHTYVCCQGVRNVTFSENFAYVLNG